MNNSEFFNFLDYIYIALMFSSTMFGFVRGFIKDFFSTCAWFGSGFIAIFVSPYLIPSVYEHVPNMTIARCIAIGISYLIILIVLLLIISAISQNVKRGVLSGIDRAVGALFGLFRGVGILVCFCILMIIFEIPRDKYEIVKNSKLSAILFDISRLLIPKMMKLDFLDKAQKSALLEKEKSLPAAGQNILDKLKKSISLKKEQKLIQKPPKVVDLGRGSAAVAPKKIPMESDKKESKPSGDPFDFLRKIKSLIEKLLTKQQVEQKTERISPVTIRRINKPRYGSMSLMEARIRRRAQRKAEKLKREIEKLLDRKNP
ncbi:MAG: CvpA family protein [Holosporaceae bacterium]|jgi:membrane protein required for colicin V production|nr:CvpA family protein [Holosporaceae bacterium]